MTLLRAFCSTLSCWLVISIRIRKIDWRQDFQVGKNLFSTPEHTEGNVCLLFSSTYVSVEKGHYLAIGLSWIEVLWCWQNLLPSFFQMPVFSCLVIRYSHTYTRALPWMCSGVQYIGTMPGIQTELWIHSSMYRKTASRQVRLLYCLSACVFLNSDFHFKIKIPLHTLQGFMFLIPEEQLLKRQQFNRTLWHSH